MRRIFYIILKIFITIIAFLIGFLAREYISDVGAIIFGVLFAGWSWVKILPLDRCK